MGVPNVVIEERVEDKTIPTYESSETGQKITYADVLKKSISNKYTKVSEQKDT